MLEYEKFQEQQAKMMKMQEEYDRQLQEMEEAKEHALEELTEYYETKIQEMTTKLEQVVYIYRDEGSDYSFHGSLNLAQLLMSQFMRFPTMWHLDICRLNEPLQPHFKLRNSKWCSVSSLTIIEYSCV